MARRTVLMMIGLFATAGAVLPATAAPPADRTDLLGDPLPAGALARVGTLRFRHLATIISVAYAPDGKSIVTGGRDGFRVWDAATGRQRLRIPLDGALLPLDEESPHALPIAFSPDGKRLATPGPDNAVVIREAATGRPVLTLRGPEKPVAALTFAPDGKTLFAMDQSRTVRGWDAAGKERLNIAGRAGRRTRGAAFALSPDGKTIAAGGPDGVRLWDAARGTELVRLPELPQVLSVAFSPDGARLAVGEGGSVHLWDRAGGRRREVFDLDARGHADWVAFSPDGKILARGGGEVAMCDATSGEAVGKARPGGAAAFSPDGRTLAVAHGPALGFLDARTGAERPTYAGHTLPLRALAFSPDGKTLATAAPDCSVRFWDAATGKETTGPRGKAIHASSLAFAPDGRRLVAGASLTGTIWANYLVCVWDADTGKELPQRFQGHSEAIHRVLFAADGKTFFTGSAAGDVAVWDSATGQEVRRFKDANRRVYDLAISPDGKTLAAGGHAYVVGREQKQDVEGAVRLLDAATGQERMTLRTHDGAVLGVGFTADGRSLVSLGTRDPLVLFSGLRLGLGAAPRLTPASITEPVVLWELATGLPRLRLLSGRDGVWRLAVSPDGRLAALGCRDGSVRVWDLLAGRERRRFDGGAAVSLLAFSPDGRVLASGGGDATVLLWDMRAVPPAPPARAPDGAELAALWADLADEPPAAYRAIGRLAAAPKEAVPFLGERVRPAVAPDAATVARLLADLDSNSFGKRERATTELRRLGDLAGPALRQFLRGAPAPEGRRRAREIVADLDRDLPRPEQLRDLRAVEALEWAGASDVLRKLAAGMPEARLTREAKAALGTTGREEAGGMSCSTASSPRKVPCLPPHALRGLVPDGLLTRPISLECGVHRRFGFSASATQSGDARRTPHHRPTSMLWIGEAEKPQRRCTPHSTAKADLDRTPANPRPLRGRGGKRVYSGWSQ